MPLSWNEIRSNAIGFSKEWATGAKEDADAKSFWDDFFRIFGLTRRHVASFEEPVKNLSGSYGFIDLFWKGTLLVEHKSRGKSLTKAQSQALEYIQSLQREGRGDEAPRYLIVSDFAKIALHDLEEETSVEIPLGELQQRIELFGFIPGYKQHRLEPDDPINIKAVAIMGDLHDALEAGGYHGHQLERMLVRVLFCLFAEDTGIFERSAFELFLNNHTLADGSDLGSRLAQFFAVLNTPTTKRQSNLQEELASLPYVNGELFAESLDFAAFNRDMRNALISCTRFDWSRISPAVFGALFQAVMDSKERRQKGAHYTSERDIMKTISPLFLDELKESLDKAGSSKPKLKAFLDRLSQIKLLDPACGCGNFLVVAYRELRLLELEALERLYKGSKQSMLDVSTLSRVDVDLLYGIEIEEWPARIAEVAIWLMDHQMNQRLSQAFGAYYVRLPLVKSPHIVHGNALRIDWNEVLPSKQCTYVLGNPPFVGAKYQHDQQKADIVYVAPKMKNGGLLDYVCGWYLKAAKYIQDTACTVAFVSTNSISQGEQVSVLWQELLNRYQIQIHFAHRTFSWQSEAKGMAHVHVVVIGFGCSDKDKKVLFDYQDIRGEPTFTIVKTINPYLVEGPIVLVSNRKVSLCTSPSIGIGNKPIDGGNYLFTAEQMKEFVRLEPKSSAYFRPWVGSQEFINGEQRWCLWVGNADPADLRKMPHVLERVDRVRQFRLASTSHPTNAIAKTPTRFHVENMPKSTYLVIPKVSSERRTYIPIGFQKPNVIASDLVFVLSNAKLFHFGVLTSSLHMAWVRAICGRLKSDYRYSANLVYNNYPWPEKPTDKQKEAVEAAAHGVLDARALYANSTLADLYDPLSMPTELSKAHAKLDRAVDKCYRSKPFPSDRSRVEFLFEQYQRLTQPIIPKATDK